MLSTENSRYAELAFWPSRRTKPRLSEADMEVSAKPCLELQGTAQNVSSPAMRKKYKSPGLEFVAVGDFDNNLSHEFEPGWPVALRLRPGQAYQVQAFACKKRVTEVSVLPKDAKIDDGLVFYALARKGENRAYVGDRRRKYKQQVAAWTDGLMLVCSDKSNALKEDIVYKIVVQRVATAG